MFSIITMASSTTKPTLTASAMSERLSIENPAAHIAAKVPQSASGTVMPAASVAAKRRRNIATTSITSAMVAASVSCMSWTLAATIALVMLVVAMFLRRLAATLAAGITVPLALCGTFAAMWAAGFSIDNLSLMALAVSVGFVVDDAIVMIENMFRNLERGHSPIRAALAGARQIGFTVISISISLIAAFIPLLFMGGIVGRLFREFSVTLAFAIAVSTMVSLTATPMICAYFVRRPPS